MTKRSKYDDIPDIESDENYTPIKKRLVKDQKLLDKFNNFYESEWNNDFFYTPSDFIPKFGINRQLSRYYLMNMVWEGKLFRVKYLNKTFYGNRLPELMDLMKQYIWMGVEITYSSRSYHGNGTVILRSEESGGVSVVRNYT